jgi:diguanylate cyclase (GGDEF)-like protein
MSSARELADRSAARSDFDCTAGPREVAMKILLVQSSSHDARRVGRMLEDAGDTRVVLVHVPRVSDALKRLRHESFDAVLVDPGPPDARGLEVQRRVQESMSHLPVVVLSGARDEDRDGLARAGDLDPALAPQGPHLIEALRHAIECKHAERHVEYLAYHDGLTRLPNRRLLLDRLGQAIARSQRSGKMLALLFLDLDDFKAINDTLGHAAGDTLLKGLAERLNGQIRASDTLARLGGDEFTLVLPEIATAADARHLAAKLRASLQTPFAIDGRRVQVSASIGISLYPDDGRTPEALLQSADESMYEAKRQRGSRSHPEASASWLLGNASLAAPFTGSQDLRARLADIIATTRSRATGTDMDAEAHRRIAERLEKGLEVWDGANGDPFEPSGRAGREASMRLARSRS